MKESHVPVRTCRGCGHKKPKHELIRLIWQDGGAFVDIDGSLPGRGVYSCANEQCRGRIEKNKKVLKRAFRLDG